MKRFLFVTLMLFSAVALAPAQRPRDSNLQMGDVAPDFQLYDLDGKNPVKLSSFRGKQPIVLVFGSYT